MTVRYKEFATKALAAEQSAAIDKELGRPTRGTNTGKGPHALVPAVYSPGAIGWTATECAIDEDAVSGTALLTLSDAAVAIGKKDIVVNSKTVSVDMTKDLIATKPAKYEPKSAAAAAVESK
jgi:hypothetical protein